MGMSSLNIAVSGLQAAQAGLFVTGHNMANHHTQGFTRQWVAQSTWAHRTIGNNAMGPMQIGLGTNVSGIHQIRNQFFDIRWRDTATELSFLEVRVATGMELDAIFGELQGGYRMQIALRDLNQSIQELIKEPPSVTTRANFISFASTFVDRAADASRSMEAYQMYLNNQIGVSVRRVNQLLTEINQLNRRISMEELNGSNANDFRDWRNNALDELSTLIDIQFSEDTRGNVNIWSEGHAILSGGNIMHMGLRFSAPNSPFVEPVFTMSDTILPFDPTGDNALSFFNWNRLSTAESIQPRGAIFGMIVSRGLVGANYSTVPSFNAPQRLSDLMPGVMSDIQGVLDDIMGPPDILAQIQTAWTNFMGAMTTAGLNGYIDQTEWNAFFAATGPGSLQGFINDLGIYMTQIDAYVNWDGTGTRPPSPDALPRFPALPGLTITGTPSAADRAAIQSAFNDFSSIAGNIAQPGRNAFAFDANARRLAVLNTFDMRHSIIPQAQAQFDTMFNSIITMLNRAFTEDVTGNGLPQNGRGDSAIPLFVQIRQGDGYTMDNIRINPDLTTTQGASLLPLNWGDESDPRLLEWIIGQWNSDDFITFPGWVSMSVNTFYRNFIDMTSIPTFEARGDLIDATEKMDSWTHRRMQVSAVSLEEEMSNMIRFQHAYNSSARMVNTIDQMLDRIINGMGAGRG